VLDACRAGLCGGHVASVAGALVRAGVPAVIAMQGDLPDTTAAAFVRGPYVALAAGQPVDRAVTAGAQGDPGAGRPRRRLLVAASALPARPGRRVVAEEGETTDEKLPTSKTVQGDEIHAAGPVATYGGVINTDGSVAFTGDGNVVITGKVGGNVVVGGHHAPGGGADKAGFLGLLADIWRDLAALDARALPPDDRADALAALAKISEQAGRLQPPGERIGRELDGVLEIVTPVSPSLAAQVEWARRLAQQLFR
jgi:hypothetical protein